MAKQMMRVEGGAELAASLNSISRKMSRRVMRNALELAAEPIRQTMASLAPRDPGAPDLADHMVVSPTRVEGLSENDQTAAVAIGPERGDYFYGYFQEFGTAFHSAQPFARPAFDQGVDLALRTITRQLWLELAAAGVHRYANAPASSPVMGGSGGSLL
jgi:HK97 gp10 family phage protein